MQTGSASWIFPFYLQVHSIISFLFITLLSFQNVLKLPAFHLWDASVLSPSAKTTKKLKLNVVVKKRQWFLKEHLTLS